MEELIENIARQQYMMFWDNNEDRIIDYDTWDNIDQSERDAWLAVAQWTYDNVWTADTDVYFPDHK